MAQFIQHRQASLSDLDGKTFLLQHVDQRVGYPLLIFHQLDRFPLHKSPLLLPPRYDMERANRVFGEPSC
ncbi:hypothetical protein MJ581_25730 [Escherichia coli]|nr:hypothetical protein MJ581_25730 [Escherichia coli]